MEGKTELLWFLACFEILVRVFKNLYNINLWYGGFTLHNELHFKQRPLKIFLLKHSRGGELLRLTIAESNSCDCLKDRTTQQFSHQTDKQRNVQTVWGDVFPPKLWMSKQPHRSAKNQKLFLVMPKNSYLCSTIFFSSSNSMEKWGLVPPFEMKNPIETFDWNWKRLIQHYFLAERQMMAFIEPNGHLEETK